MIGVLSGAGYALFENLTIFTDEANWLAVVLIRLTTSAMHMLTAGLTGWALANAWQKRRYLRMLAAYSLAVLIHSLWNGSVILIAMTNLLHNISQLRNPPVLPYHLQFSGMIVMAVLIIGSFTLLIASNRKLGAKVVVEYAAGSESESDILEGD